MHMNTNIYYISYMFMYYIDVSMSRGKNVIKDNRKRTLQTRENVLKMVPLYYILLIWKRKFGDN